jgi:hypothetical protein
VKSQFIKKIQNFIFFLFFCIPFSGWGQTSHWQIGEELTYNVRWGFLNLGTLNYRVIDTTRYNNELAYRVSLKIDSSPYVFFVSMHYYYESYISTDLYPMYFYGEEIDGDTRTRYRYFFDREGKKILTEVSLPNDTLNYQKKEFPMPTPVQDGMSLVNYARGNVYEPKSVNVTAFYDLKFGDFIINFVNNRIPLELDVFQQPIEGVELNGTTTIKAIAGFSGAFRGWFSTDGRAVPLRAKMKVFIGSVTVDLEKWKNWDPPVPPKNKEED